MTEELWYRYDDVRYAAPLDEFDNPMGEGRVELQLSTFRVLSTTPKGAWLDTGVGTRRFVLSAARKRYACPTEAEAKLSFVARKQAQLRILEAQTKQVRQALELVTKLPSPPYALPAYFELSNDS